MNEELVSVIIPTYNRKLKYLSRAVKSVMQQTYNNYEIIVVDDNPYKSKQSIIIKEFCIRNNITYIKTKGIQGANNARNIGANNAKGAYFAFLDDDDKWLPDKLELQVKSFSEGVGMVYSNGYVISSSTKQWYTRPKYFVDKGELHTLLLYNYIGPTVAALIKKECFFSVGMFDENIPAKQDYDLWIRIIKKYKVIGIKKPLFIYTQHNSHQITKNYSLLIEGYLKIYQKNLAYYDNDIVLNFLFALKIAVLFKCQKKYIYFFKCLFYLISITDNKNFKILY